MQEIRRIENGRVVIRYRKEGVLVDGEGNPVVEEDNQEPAVQAPKRNNTGRSGRRKERRGSNPVRGDRGHGNDVVSPTPPEGEVPPGNG